MLTKQHHIPIQHTTKKTLEILCGPPKKKKKSVGQVQVQVCFNTKNSLSSLVISICSKHSTPSNNIHIPVARFIVLINEVGFNEWNQISYGLRVFHAKRSFYLVPIHKNVSRKTEFFFFLFSSILRERKKTPHCFINFILAEQFQCQQ